MAMPCGHPGLPLRATGWVRAGRDGRMAVLIEQQYGRCGRWFRRWTIGRLEVDSPTTRVTVVDVSASLLLGQQSGIVTQAALQGGIAVQRAKITEQLAGAGEQHGLAVDHCLMCDVLSKHRLADALRPDKHDVGGLLEKVERNQRINSGAVAVLGPGPGRVV